MHSKHQMDGMQMNQTNHNMMSHDGMSHHMKSMNHNMKNRNMQSSPHHMDTVSWFSREEEKREPHDREGANWMQSRPEDSMMGGHMQHGMGNMPEMSHDMDNMSEMNQMQHMGH
jgi:hypothetical protein